MGHAETRAGIDGGRTCKVLNGGYGAPAGRDRTDILSEPVDGARLGLSYTC